MKKTIKLLGEACSDAQWLTRMVENLLSITRISGEQTAISKEYEAAEEILAASVHKFEKRFKSNIRIAVEVPQEVVLVPMDATLIQQVLLNLMENAVLHGESTTELRLSVEHIGDEACFRRHLAALRKERLRYEYPLYAALGKPVYAPRSRRAVRFREHGKPRRLCKQHAVAVAYHGYFMEIICHIASSSFPR